MSEFWESQEPTVGQVLEGPITSDELLGRTVDLEGFEIEYLADMLRKEIGVLRCCGTTGDGAPVGDLEDILEKLTS